MKTPLLNAKILSGSYGNLAIISGLFIIAAAVSAFGIKLTQWFFDSLGSTDQLNTSLLFLACLIGMKLVQLVVQHYQSYTEQKITMLVTRRLEHQLVDIINPQTVTHLETPQYQNDVNFLRQNFFTVCRLLLSTLQFANYCILFCIYFVMICSSVWYVSLLTILYSVPHFINEIHLSKINYTYVESTNQLTREKGFLYETMIQPLAQKEILIFQTKKFFMDKWNRVAGESLKHEFLHNKKLFYKNLATAFAEPIGFGAVQVILLFSVYHRTLTIGQYVSLTSAVTLLQNSLYAIGNYSGQIRQAYLTSRQLKQFVQNYINDRTRDSNVQPQSFIGPLTEISLKGLTFQYPNRDIHALKNIHLTIGSNRVVAIVGDNGSGKSTLGKALLGLYEVPRGMIYYNGIDLCDLNREQLFPYLTVVTQDFVRYPITLSENITFSSASSEHQRALNHLNERYPGLLPQDVPLESKLGIDFTKSRQLSGGQWQKIAISRALFKQCPFLVLDEATSSLDPESDMRIMTEIVSERRDRLQTTIMITHRLPICSLADEIVVLHDGQIAERGSESDLLKCKGKYYQMFRSQNRNKEGITVG